MPAILNEENLSRTVEQELERMKGERGKRRKEGRGGNVQIVDRCRLLLIRKRQAVNLINFRNHSLHKTKLLFLLPNWQINAVRDGCLCGGEG